MPIKTMTLVAVFSAVIFSGYAAGNWIKKTTSAPYNNIQGLWTGKAILPTASGYIYYDVDLLINGDKFVFSTDAQIEKGPQFAHRADFNYVSRQKAEVVITVSGRQSMWLTHLREKGSYDIPVMGHVMRLNLVKLNENEIFFSKPLQGDREFALIAKRSR